MSFTYPAFLIAFLAIAVPIIIHLFNFRKFKTVYFSNVRFLKEVKQETQAKSKLKHLLVLFARILAIIFIVLAFAQPFIPVDNRKVIVGEKIISIFIDNSFSMDAINKNGSLLDDAKRKAMEIISVYKPTDRFQLLTNDFEGKHQRLVNKEEFIQLLDEVKISPATRTLPEITSRSFDVLNQTGSKNKIDFILSDFQKSTSDFEHYKNDTSIAVNLVPLIATEKSNVFVDTCWFESPVRQFNQMEQLHVRIKNVSSKVIENNSIKLFINSEQKTPASFSVGADNETEVILSFVSKNAGIQHCRIELSDYPVTFDDAFYFSFAVTKNIPVLVINSGTSQSPYLNKLFGGDSLFVLKNESESAIDYATLSNHKLIVLNELKSVSSGMAEELKRFVSNGGSVLVFPGADADIISYKAFLSPLGSSFYLSKDTANTKIAKINLEHAIYKDVFDKKNFVANNLDLPKVTTHYVLSKQSRSIEENLLQLENGDVFLEQTELGKGKLYLCAVPLENDFSNFTKHALFVPTLYKIGMYSQQVLPLFYTIGKDESIETTTVLSGENVFHIHAVIGDFDAIPEHLVMDSKTKVLLNNQIKQANNYYLSLDKEPIMGISFNYDRKESDLNCLSDDELKIQINEFNLFNINILNNTEQNLAATLSELGEGKKLWKVCLILALIFLGIEVLLLRYMKG